MLVRTLALLIFALLSVGEEARGQTPGHVVDDGNGDDVGCVVTGTITRHSDELVRLNVGDGYTLEVTPRHRLYSATRGQWVAAGDLGEEDLRTQSGTTHVQPAGHLPGPVQVFNLEVFGTHRYFVGQAQVLAHNSYNNYAARGAGQIDDAASAATTVGRRGQQVTFPNPRAPTPRNAPGTAGGRDFSGHAFDRMQERGFTPSVVENAIQHGQATPGTAAGTVQHFDPVNKFNVITDAATGRVITVF